MTAKGRENGWRLDNKTEMQTTDNETKRQHKTARQQGRATNRQIHSVWNLIFEMLGTPAEKSRAVAAYGYDLRSEVATLRGCDRFRLRP